MNFDELGWIRVGGFHVSVVDGTEALEYQSLDGAWLGSEHLIQIRTNIDPQSQAETLVHEICHAINAVYLEPCELTEAVIALFSEGLFQVIVDNPQLLAEIVRCAEEGDNAD